MISTDSYLLTPILVIGFNRFSLLKMQVDRLNSLGFKNIYVSIDGPRNENDRIEIEKIRDFLSIKKNQKMLKKVLLSKSNLGCKNGVTSAIDWFFSNVVSGIILEDDIYFDISFLRFSVELLKKYEKEKNIFMISANNFFPELKIKESYTFVSFAPIWGWATWRNRWLFHKNFIESLNSKSIQFYSRSLKESKVYSGVSKVLKGKLDTWDYLLNATIILNKKVSIVPKVHLIENRGLFKSTHTYFKNFLFLVPKESIDFPLVHPSIEKVFPNKELTKKFTMTQTFSFMIIKTVDWYITKFFKCVSNFFQTKQ